MTDKEDLNPFSIPNPKAFEVIIEMLVEISARQRVLAQLFYKDAKSKEDLSDALDDLTKSMEFHKAAVYESLFSRYSDLRDLLPPDVHQPGD